MALTLAILVLSMLAPRAVHGQGSAVLPDTVRLQPPEFELPAFLSPFPGRTGQGGYTVGQIGLKPVPLLVPIELDVPAVVTDGPTPDLSRWVVARGPTLIRRRLALRQRDLFKPVPPGGTLRGGVPTDSGLVSGIADLDFEIVGQAELGGDWTRFRPCDTNVVF